MSYGNTGNSQYSGITTGQLNQFESSIPKGYSGVPQEVASGGSGSEIQPTTPVVIAPGGTNFSYDFTTETYLLAGSNSTLNLSPSNGARPVDVNVQLSGHDTITLNHGADAVLDKGGYNHITTSGGNDTVTSAGHNLITVHGSHNVIYGNSEDTINLGFSSGTVVDAGPGPETITGGVNSFISGGGNTSISGGFGNTVSLMGHDTLGGGSTGAFNDTVSVAANSHALVKAQDSANMDITVQAGRHAHTGGDTGQDTIFGGSNTVVHVGNLGAITGSSVDPSNSKLTEVHFASGDTLYVHNVTLDLGNNHTKSIS